MPGPAAVADWPDGRSRRSCPNAEAAQWRRRTRLLIALLLAFRWLYAACVPLELVADEAYYWEWSRQLDWGYYSKPPMVAWIIRLATELVGSSAWAVRTPAVLLGTLSIWWIALLATRMFDARVGFWSAVLCAVTPGNAAVGLLMTIDAPFLFCWGLSMYGLWRMLERDSNRGRWVVATGISIGFGLLSKESMLAFLMSAWLFVLVSRDDRGELRRPGWWLMSSLGLLCVAPVIVWNSRHDWVTLQHSSTHFETQAADFGARLSRCGEFVLGQMGMLSPVLFVVFMAGSVLALRQWRQLTRSTLFLLCFGVVPLSCVFALSLTRRVMPNWPAPFYAAGLILTSAWLSGRTEFGAMPGSWRWLFPSPDRVLWRSVWCGIACAGLACACPWGVHWIGLEGSRFDPTVRLRGWSAFAEQIAHSHTSAPQPDATFVLVATGRQEASELAFYLPEQPRVSLWNPTATVHSQYDLWSGPVGQTGRDALIVTGPASRIDARIAKQFRSIQRCRSAVDVALGNGRSRQYDVWLGHDYRPDPGGTVEPGAAAFSHAPSPATLR